MLCVEIRYICTLEVWGTNLFRYKPQLAVVYANLKSCDLFGRKYGWCCPLGLRGFDETSRQHFFIFGLFKLSSFRYYPVFCLVLLKQLNAVLGNVDMTKEVILMDWICAMVSMNGFLYAWFCADNTTSSHQFIFSSATTACFQCTRSSIYASRSVQDWCSTAPTRLCTWSCFAYRALLWSVLCSASHIDECSWLNAEWIRLLGFPSVVYDRELIKKSPRTSEVSWHTLPICVWVGASLSQESSKYEYETVAMERHRSHHELQTSNDQLLRICCAQRCEYRRLMW